METLKEFQQKIKNRKFAMDHSWKTDVEKAQKYEASDLNFEENTFDNHLWNQLNENLEAADADKTFTGYWLLSSNKKWIGAEIVFIKKVIRKLLKIFMGWYIFPHYQKMSYFNGKVVNAISFERDLLRNLTQKINQQQQQIGQLLEENRQMRIQLRKMENLPTDDEEFYHAFEEKFRGSEDLIRERQRVYVPIIKQYISDWTKAKFIDVGSGRGEWLDILRENGAKNYVGIDLNAQQNALCEARGHHVLQMDCLAYLASQPDNSVDMVSGFQIIEHLAMSDLMELLQQSYRVLKPGGMILFETQNPRNLIVGADTFYIDPSHKRPLDPRMIAFIVKWCGYSKVKIIDANSSSQWGGVTVKATMEETKEIIRQFNDLCYLMYGPQDYAVIGVKEK